MLTEPGSCREWGAAGKPRCRRGTASGQPGKQPSLRPSTTPHVRHPNVTTCKHPNMPRESQENCYRHKTATQRQRSTAARPGDNKTCSPHECKTRFQTRALQVATAYGFSRLSNRATAHLGFAEGTLTESVILVHFNYNSFLTPCTTG